MSTRRLKDLLIVILLSVSVALSGCTVPAGGDGDTLMIHIYYMNAGNRKISYVDYEPAARGGSDLVEEMLDEMEQQPDDVDLLPVLNGSFSINSYFLNYDGVTIDLDSRYLLLDTITEVLTRAAIVRTLTQADGVSSVTFTVNGEALLNSDGEAYGPMNAEMFVDNSGTEINNYERTVLKLYFADKSGDKLLAAERTVVYNTNISIEKLVVEQLISGPETKGLYPVINPQTTILGVIVRDGTCYVNFSSSFLTQPYNVSTEVAIYSIVNSLTELNSVRRVQIAVDGENDMLYMNTTSLSEIYERNTKLAE
ncbi:MAG: GerMN domain-containing protein [Lachnospiraceae bacterium]|nr:GerMN domain-containing protein [Lachnospiraceae bacterium]